MYGPFDSKTFEQKYRGEAVYNQEVRASITMLPVVDLC